MEIKRLDENRKVRQEFYEYALKCCDEGIELWVDVDGHVGLYQVSNFGRIKSLERIINSNHGTRKTKDKIISQFMSRNGYLNLKLYNNHKISHYRVNRLVAIMNIPNFNNYPEVNHKDGVKTNNKLSNLEWVTRSSNAKHAFDTGLLCPKLLSHGSFGRLHHRSKETFQYSMDGVFIKKYGSVLEASRCVGVSHSCIIACSNGKQVHAGYFKWIIGENVFNGYSKNL